MYDPMKPTFQKITALSIAGLLLLTALTGCKKDPVPTDATTLPPSVQETTAPIETTVAPEQVIATGKVTTEELNVRAGVGVAYEVVTTLKQDYPVEILEFFDLNGVRWGRIKEGWICLIYVHIDGEPMHNTEETEPFELTEPIMGKVIATELNIRSGPSTNYKVVTSLEKDDTITITEMVGIWGKCEDGWVNTIFVYFEGTIDTTKLDVTVTATKLNMRTGPSTAYNIIREVEKGTDLQIIKQVTIRDVRWGYTGEGWICMAYVEAKN